MSIIERLMTVFLVPVWLLIVAAGMLVVIAWMVVCIPLFMVSALFGRVTIEKKIHSRRGDSSDGNNK